MSVKFTVKESLYAICGFEIKNATREDVENTLEQIGEGCSAEDLAMQLINIFGSENVETNGINSTDNVESNEEHEFWDWED